MELIFDLRRSLWRRFFRLWSTWGHLASQEALLGEVTVPSCPKMGPQGDPKIEHNSKKCSLDCLCNPHMQVFWGKLFQSQFVTDLRSDSGVSGTSTPCIPYEKGCKISIFTISYSFMVFRSALDPKRLPNGSEMLPGGRPRAPLLGKRHTEKLTKKH